MSIGTGIAIIIGSIIISCGLSELGKIGRPRNKYDDYVQAMLDLNHFKSWNNEESKFFDSPTQLVSFINGLQEDVRKRFLNDNSNRF